MFAGGQRRSSNVRAMQLFHELKQQFPTVPDHVVTSCISAHTLSSQPEAVLKSCLEALAAQELMGRSPPPTESPAPPNATTSLQHRPDMNDTETVKSSVSYSKQNDSVEVNSEIQRKVDNSTFYAKRPDTLGIKTETLTSFDESDNSRKLQLSEKCKDVFKLLNQVVDKPPRSPISAKRMTMKNSPTSVKSPFTSPDVNRRLLNLEETGVKKKETVSTPTQTTDTLITGVTTPSSVNLSLNVNCSMDLVQSPTKPKHTTVLQVTPQQPWLQDPISPRSYTSVNLTLRPPSSEPQAPIDITSQNSSLTYSTSSFDSQRGLQSRLQITVGPSGGSVASIRARPRSSYHPQSEVQDLLPTRAVSLNSLVDNDKPPVILQQEARLERIRIELKTEKAKLIIKQKDFEELQREKKEKDRVNEELKKQLEREINHLMYQCRELENKEGRPFYDRIYTGQRDRITTEFPELVRIHPFSNAEWNCSMCTFLNHPDLSKCEQCDMPKTFHGTQNPSVTREFNSLPAQANNAFDVSEMLQSLRQNGVSNHDQILDRLSTRNDNDLFNSCPLQQSNSTPNIARNNVISVVNNNSLPNHRLSSSVANMNALSLNQNNNIRPSRRRNRR